MPEPTRREFAAATVGALAVTTADAADPAKPEIRKPVEAPSPGGYDRPKFQPGWKKPQLNRELVQDFVMFGHGDLAMVKKLLEIEPALLNAAVDWGGGDWETALGGASLPMLTTAPASPGEIITLRLMIFDEGDGLLDSSVLLDAFTWHTESIAQPNIGPF